MINTYAYDNETWIDVNNGTPEEIHGLMDKYRIHPLVAKELTSATEKPRIEFHNGYAYCILHFPAWKHTHGPDSNQEVDFIIGRNILITARYDTIDSLHKFSKMLEVKQVTDDKHVEKYPQFMFVSLLRELYQGLHDELAAVEDAIEDITKRIYQGDEREMVVAISLVTRTLLQFKRATDLHHDVLDSLHHYGKKIFGDEFGKQMELTILDYLKINSNIQSSLDMLKELRETNNALLTTKQNETMRQLTAMGFIILPLNLIAVIFGMRVTGLPLVDNPNAFWMVLVVMAASVIITVVYGRHKKWI